MSGYFSKFPSVMYGNALATNITSRLKMMIPTRDRIKVFHDYVLKEGERPDTVAEHYYGDPYFAWLVYYANEIIDPYFEWPLNQQDFNKFIAKKYTTITAAQEKILFFRVNWSTDENMLSPGAYDSLLNKLKRYWAPVIGYQQNIISYQRAQLDWVLETNRIVELTLSAVDLAKFNVDNKITQSGGTSGFIRSITSTALVVNNIEGEFLDTLSISFNNNTGDVLSVVKIGPIDPDTGDVLDPIPVTEIPYWSSVVAYDYEEELNESRKQIRLIDKSYLNQIELEMKALLT